MPTSPNLPRLRHIIEDKTTVDERLAITNAYLAAIFENAQEAIIAKNLDQIITAWNPAAERLYGYTPQEATGQSIRMIVPDDRKDELDNIMSRLSRGELIEPFKTQRKRKDGKVIDVVLTVSPVSDRAGNVIGASAIAHPWGEWNDQPY